MLLKKLKAGAWFDFDAKSTNPQRVKLAWVNSKTLHFMFVNSLGQQMALKSAEQLASEMRTGNIKVNNRLQQKPFFEKAMERVLDQLQRKETKFS